MGEFIDSYAGELRRDVLRFPLLSFYIAFMVLAFAWGVVKTAAEWRLGHRGGDHATDS